MLMAMMDGKAIMFICKVLYRTHRIMWQMLYHIACYKLNLKVAQELRAQVSGALKLQGPQT